MTRTIQQYREIITMARTVALDPEHFACRPGLTVKDYARNIMEVIDDLTSRLKRDFESRPLAPAMVPELAEWIEDNLRFPWERSH